MRSINNEEKIRNSNLKQKQRVEFSSRYFIRIYYDGSLFCFLFFCRIAWENFPLWITKISLFFLQFPSDQLFFESGRYPVVYNA